MTPQQSTVHNRCAQHGKDQKEEVIYDLLKLSTETRLLVLEVDQSSIQYLANLFRSRSFQFARQSGRILRPSACDKSSVVRSDFVSLTVHIVLFIKRALRAAHDLKK